MARKAPHQRRGQSAKEIAFRQRKMALETRAPVESEDEEETIQEDAQVPDHRGIDPEESSVDSAGTGENSSFIKRPKKKKPKKRTSRSADDSDEEPARTPFSESHLANKQVQRLNNHPKMARSARKSGKSGSSQPAKRTSPRQEAKRKAAALKNDDDYLTDDDDRTVDAREGEVEVLKRELEKLKAKNKVISAQRTTLKECNLKSMIKSGTASAEQRLVYLTAKTDLWKVQKFIYADKELIQATTVVMNMLDLKDLEGLEGTDLELAQANWVRENAQIVRCAINDQRNYVVGECFKLVKRYYDDHQEGRVPHKDTVMLLALRELLPKTEEECDNGDQDMQAAAATFQWYWDELVPKVAGHSNWGPGKRHHGLLSFMKPHDSNVPYVTPSDEAFIVTIWENYMDSWYWKLEQGRNDPNFKVNPKNEDHMKAIKTPFTLPQGGANKWGGWNKAGRQFYRETLRKIISTKDTPEKIADVEAKEQEALRKIRIHHRVEEQEAARKKSKNSTNKEELDSDHEPEFAMYYR